MIVIDLGCHDHPDHQGSSQDSIGALIERFHPHKVYGFDPHSDLLPGPSFSVKGGGTWIYRERKAAWTRNGETGFTDQGLGSHTHATTCEEKLVPCFDLAEWLHREIPVVPVVLKLDVEGAEYAILEHLIETDAIRHVERLLVEWHDLPAQAERRDSILSRLTCPVEEWH